MEGGRGEALAWVRDRGECYLLRPLLLAGINVLAVGFLLFISLSRLLCAFLVAIPFSFRPLWLSFLAGVRGPYSVVRLLQP